MIKTLFFRVFVVLTIIISLASLAFAGSSYTIVDNAWDYYYYAFKIKGYPTFNSLYDRYDFYDLAGTYCGSLKYNNILENWEYFGI